MRVILMALAVSISVSAVTRPALAGAVEPQWTRTDIGPVVKILAQSDRDIPQIGVGIVADSNNEPPLVQQWHYENQDAR